MTPKGLKGNDGESTISTIKPWNRVSMKLAGTASPCS